MTQARIHGWMGKIIRVDLTQGKAWREDIPVDLLHSYLGGRGLGVRLLRDHYQLDPLAPEMPLIFAGGPLCGTPAPTSARLAVVSRSPLTGTVCDCSAGGRFAWRFKRTGVDALFITGKSPSPVLLEITPTDVRIIPADSLWGKATGEVFTVLAGRGSIAAIGPAGENGVLFANIMMGEGNAVGRGGLGAVMGAKNLKAIIVEGDVPTAIHDPERLDHARQDAMRLFRASPVIFGELGISEYGTPALVDLLRTRRMTPTENFRRTFFDDAVHYAGPAIRKAYSPKKDGCYGCPIQCKKSTQTGEHLPEFETVSHFGALNCNGDLESIVAANHFCNEAGMDTISAAASISAFAEARGSFPAGAELLRLLADTVELKDDGKLIALGSRRLTEEMGSPELSMSVKSSEMPAYDPRGAYGMALAYCTSNRGACHLRAYPMSHEVLRKPVATDRFSFSGKARIIAIAEDTNAAIDSMVACKFAFFGASLEEYGEMISAVAGWEYDPQSLKKVGARVFLTERFYNCKNGFSAKDDRLPERFFREAGTSGNGIDIPPLDRQRFEEELQKYYRIRGVDENGCFPDSDFLAELP